MNTIEMINICQKISSVVGSNAQFATFLSRQLTDINSMTVEELVKVIDRCSDEYNELYKPMDSFEHPNCRCVATPIDDVEISFVKRDPSNVIPFKKGS